MVQMRCFIREAHAHWLSADRALRSRTETKTSVKGGGITIRRSVGTRGQLLLPLSVCSSRTKDYMGKSSARTPVVKYGGGGVH